MPVEDRPPPSSLVRVSRRDLLRGVGALSAVTLLAACGGGGEPSGAASPSPTNVEAEILQRLGIEAPHDLAFVLTQGVFISGEPKHLAFGLATTAGEYLSGLAVELSVVRDRDLALVEGPKTAPSHETFGRFSVYTATVTFPEPGAYWVVAAAPDRAGVGALQVRSSQDITIPKLGESFPSAPTPTRANLMGIADLCTRRPPCSMHDVSLDAARTAGRPIVLTVATPAFCQTAICGPVVDVIEQAKQSSNRRDVAWIHVEVYKDAGNTPVALVTDTLKLPSEPWTFFVAADGALKDKLEGPTPHELVGEALQKI